MKRLLGIRMKVNALTMAVVMSIILFQSSIALASEAIDEVKRFAKYSQKFSEIYLGYVDLFTDSMELDEIIVGVTSGEVSKEYGLEAGQSKLIRLKLGLARVDTKLDNISVPKFKRIKYAEFIRDSYSYLYSLKDQIHGFFDDSGQMFFKLQNGQKIDENEALRRSITRTKILLTGENRILEIRLLISKPNHPEYYSNKIYILGNQHIIEVLGGLLEWSQSEISEQVFKDRMALNNEKVRGIISLLRKGKNAADTMKSKLRLSKRVDENFRKTLLAALDTYEESFKTESIIAAVLENLTSGFFDGGTYEEIYATYMKNASKLEILVDKRMSLALRRQDLIANMR
jgi:hypothetical protein